MSKTDVATAPQHKGLLEVFGEKYNVPARLVRETLQKTAFPDAKSDAEFIAMLTVANIYDLNPFLRQVYAFSSNGKVVPVVSIDGWIKVINEQETLESIEFAYADKKAVIGSSKPCFEWIECSIERSDRDKPITVREYFDECYKNTPPWNQSPKRMLRHRALIQAGRLAFGLAFREPEDVSRMQEEDDFSQADIEVIEEEPKSSAEKAKRAMRKPRTPRKAAEPADGPPAAPDEVVDGEFSVPAGVSEVIIDDVLPDEGIEEGEWEEDLENPIPEHLKNSANPEVEPVIINKQAVDDLVEKMGLADVPAEDEPELKHEKTVTARELGAISAARSKNNWTPELFQRLLAEFGVENVNDLPAGPVARDFIKVLQSGREDVQGGML